MKWYVSRNGETIGPVDEPTVRLWVQQGMTDAYVRNEIGGNWILVTQSPFYTHNNLRPLVLLGVFVVCVGYLAWAFNSCSKDIKTNQQADVQKESKENLINAEADDTVRVIRLYWLLGYKVHKEDWKVSVCLDNTHGYDNTLKCITEAYDSASGFAKALSEPRHKMANSPCGHEIEDAHLKLIPSTVKYLGDWRTFFINNEQKLRPVMRNKAFSDVDDDRFKDNPSLKMSMGEYVSPGAVATVECTKLLFICGAPDNVCWINKVAARALTQSELGAEKDHKACSSGRHCELRVRATNKLLY